MSFKTAPKENLSRDAEQEWHDRTSRHDVTVPKCCPQLPNTAQVARVCHLAQSCHLAAQPSVPVWLGLAMLRGSDSVGLSCDAFLQLFSPSWRFFLLNVVHLSASSIKFLKISQDVV